MQKFLHFHLPKTGGTTLRHHLVEQLGANQVTPALAGIRLTDALLEWQHMPAISGHFSPRQGDRLPSDRYSFTVLRNPVDRFLSEFFYSKVDNSSRPLDGRTHALDLDAYLASLTDKDHREFPLQLEMLYPLGTVSQSVLSPEEKLAAALQALEAFNSVGIQEELEDFTCMLDSRFQWPYRPPARINVTSYRLGLDDLSAPQHKRLKQLLEAEMELYQRARELFRQQRRLLLSRAQSVQEPAVPAVAAPGQAQPAAAAPKNFGDLHCTIKAVRASGSISGDDRSMIGEQLAISIEFEAKIAVPSLNIGIAIRDDRGVLVYGTNSMLLGDVFTLAPGRYVAAYRMLNRMPIGRYSTDIALMPTESHYDGCYHWIEQAAWFDVYDTAVTIFEGKLLMDAQVELTPVSASSSCSSAPYITANRPIRAKARVNQPLSDFSSKTTAMCSPQTAQSGGELLLPVRVKNESALTWHAFGLQHVVLSYRWYTPEGVVVVADGLRTQLPDDLQPGQSVVVALQVKVPDSKGKLVLKASPLQENVAWFMDRQPGSTVVFDLSVT